MEPHTLTSNKSVIREFYRRTLGQGDLDYADRVVSEDYIQHNPSVKPGKAGLMEALASFKQMPRPANPAPPFMRLIAEGDYVVTNLRFGWAGRHTVVVDLFRLKAGKIVEHWDATQVEPPNSPNGHPMMDGPVEAAELHLTEANKQVVAVFYQRAFIGQQTSQLVEFLHPELMQHHPEIDNGSAGLIRYLRETDRRLSVRKVHRVIGEGNFVVVQAEGILGEKRHAVYDIFRLDKGLIVEQWSVSQPIPDAMPHANGML